MNKALVVYFSRSGHTRSLAREIATNCGADLESVEDFRSRAGFFGYFRSAREALKKIRIKIKPITKHPSHYDLVVVGTPVWAGNLSSPMRAYLAAYGPDCRRVAFFCAQGGSGAEKVFREMAELCGRSPLTTAAFNDREIKQRRYEDKMTRFVDALSLPQDHASRNAAAGSTLHAGGSGT